MSKILVDSIVLQRALDYIVAINKSSDFWLVPESNLNIVTSSLRNELSKPKVFPSAWLAVDEEGNVGLSLKENIALRSCTSGAIAEPLYAIPQTLE